MSDRKIITIFGSSKPEPGSAQYEIAFEIGTALAEAGYTVCNGGYGGTMEASAAGAKRAGGQTLGIVTDFFDRTPNRWLDRKIVTPTLAERLLQLVRHGDGYVVLQGGTGTLLELACVWEFMNRNVVDEKPIVAVGNFWDDVIRTVEKELALEGFGGSALRVHRVVSAAECIRVLNDALK